MDWDAELAAIIQPMAQDGVAAMIDWEPAELALGVHIPADYKAFLARWPHGKLADFIHFFAPFAQSKALRLPQATQGFVAAYATLKAHHPQSYPLPLIPLSGGLLPFAITDNGDYLGWVVSDGSPDTWPVAVLGDEEGVPEVFAMPFGPFLLGLVKGTTRPAAFPEDAFDQLPLAFVPY